MFRNLRSNLSIILILCSSCSPSGWFGKTTQDPSSVETAEEFDLEVSSEQSASARPVSEAQVDRSATFVFRIPSEPETLDWNRAHSPVETYILLNIMEGLVELNHKLEVVPALAQSWTISDEGKTYRFKLRQDVKWSDGQELRAGDFIYSWKRLLSKGTASPYAYLFFDVKNAKKYFEGQISDFNEVGIRAEGDQTLVIELERAIPYWIQLLSFWATYPMRGDGVERYAHAWTKPGNMLTLGPFLLRKIDKGSRIHLERNPYYYRDRGNIKHVVAQVVRSDSAALRMFSRGKIDFVSGLSHLGASGDRWKNKLKVFPYLKVAYLGFNTKVSPFDNVHFRRAVSMAIDKQELVAKLNGRQRAATSFVPPPLKGFSTKVGLAFNPGKAKKELKKSGVGSLVRSKVELLTPTWDKEMTASKNIRQQLRKNLKIRVSIQAFDYKSFRAQLDLDRSGLFQGIWGADFPDADNFMSVFLSQSGTNKTNWKSKKYDQMLMGARHQLGPIARLKSYIRIQKFLQEENAVVVPLFYEPNMALVSEKVRGLHVNAINYVYLRKVNLF